MALAAAVRAAAASMPSCTSLHMPRGWLASLLQNDTDVWGSLRTSGASRTQHVVARPAFPQSVVPANILQELNALDSHLRAASRIDGRSRASQPLSAPALPAALGPALSSLPPPEPGLPALEAHVRPPGCAGKQPNKWLRRAGRVPGRVYSLPGGQGEAELLLHFDERDLARLVRTFGRVGCQARALALHIVAPSPPSPPPSASPSSPSSSSSSPASLPSPGAAPAPPPLASLRVLPTRLFVNAVSQRVEGVDLLHCPPERVVGVDVPVRLVNDDLAPGVKKGGWMAMAKRTVRYRALGSSIPPYVEVNVRQLDLEQQLLVRDMPVPAGSKLAEKDFNALVLRCTTDVGKD